MSAASSLPAGTATFLFTDIEGSTRLLDVLGDEYAAVLRRHRELLLGACTRHGGIPVGSEGDSLFVVFERASAAVAAAVDGQRALAVEPWPGDAPIRVRMGAHSGEAEVVDDDYVGMAVHVAARVAAAAHGGQILLTDVTARLAGDLDAVDLGAHRLKDVGEHRLVQVRAAGLAEEFPPIRSLSGMPNNLPAPVDAFIGREAVVDPGPPGAPISVAGGYVPERRLRLVSRRLAAHWLDARSLAVPAAPSGS